MGCGCKNESQFVVENQEITNDKKTILRDINIEEKVENFLLRKNKFSIFGVILFLLTTPIVVTIVIPITVIILFNKFVFGTNSDPVKLMVFGKDKKPKK